MIPINALVLLALLTTSQNKPASPAVPFAQILACVQAANCKNMTPARMSVWSDVGPGMGMVFEDNGWKYELSLSGPVASPRDLAIMTTGPGETRPGQLITLDNNGKLVSASLARLPGEPAVASRTEPIEESWKRRKAFVAEPRWTRGGTLGEEFRPYWQKLADQALAAIARTLTRDPQAQEKPAISFDQIVSCAKAADCRNMTKSSVRWFDQIGIPVIAFSDDSGGYALAVSRRDDRVLSIWITVPGQDQPSQLLSVGPEDTVLTGELGPMAGDVSPAVRQSPEQREQWRARHKAFSSPARTASPGGIPPTGAEFKTFWEGKAAQALAAIRRQVSK